MRRFVDEQTLTTADPDRTAEVFARAAAIARDAQLALRLPNVQLRPTRTPGCTWPTTGAYFSYRGDIMPCCMIATPDRYSFGKIGDNSFSDVWNGDDYGRFREQLASGEPPEICRSCAVYAGTF